VSRPCAVALTGGLASGKSTVAAGLKRRGAAVIDADQVVHQLYAPGAAGATAVAKLFGCTVLADDGAVDRDALGQLVLADTDALQRLNQTIHPLVRSSIQTWLDQLEQQPKPPQVALVEAALLVETGSYQSYDLLVVVWCRPEQQLQRAIARGMTESRARQVLAAQMPIDDKCGYADVVVDTSGQLAELEAELDRSWHEILTRCAHRHS
jgi:dephospho-CoA kinase